MKKIISIAVLCLLLSLLAGCSKETEQDKVKKVVATVQKAAEEKDIKTINNSISKAYSDPQGNNSGSINRLLVAYFYQYPKISVYITKLDVSVTGATARAVFEAVLTSKGAAGSAPAILPDALGAYAFDVTLSKESDGWKAVSARWERIGDAGTR